MFLFFVFFFISTQIFTEPYYFFVKINILCVSFDTPGLRQAMSMIYAIDEINKNANLLPNVTLGYSLYDNCGALVIGFSGALSLASGRERQFLLQQNCVGSPPVLGIVGDSFSTSSIAISSVLGLYKMPIVSFLSPMFVLLDLCLLHLNKCHLISDTLLKPEHILTRLTSIYTVCFFIGELFFHMFLPE